MGDRRDISPTGGVNEGVRQSCSVEKRHGDKDHPAVRPKNVLNIMRPPDRLV